MGTGAVPNYTNLFMDRFETKALDNYPLKPMLWLRFIDDIEMTLSSRSLQSASVMLRIDESVIFFIYYIFYRVVKGLIP